MARQLVQKVSFQALEGGEEGGKDRETGREW
jgi:hypothetical protein